ncbi:hypothetical protein [Acetobacter vaccinii]|uniref:DUF1134 domain-containing protein n=1 Tax=Acetobacter vaccinii TaxID=2592655 RepID=A0A5C1YMX6_9PROT|nr:hypothetical protein [Acetobacter vaccinii]QEO17656.1 hypothetical protein FLP30_07895 [Acetobacter vaccinii]
MRFTPIVAAAALSFATLAPAAMAEESAMGKPSGSVVIRTKSADVGVGYTWGQATLHFQGHNYHYKVSGGQIAAVGFSEVVSRGEVYNLHRAEDMAGTFAQANGEATLGRGLGGSVYENKNGVRLKIESSAKGARLSAGAGGLTFELLKK